jgi:hypothetical protein
MAKETSFQDLAWLLVLVRTPMRKYDAAKAVCDWAEREGVGVIHLSPPNSPYRIEQQFQPLLDRGLVKAVEEKRRTIYVVSKAGKNILEKYGENWRAWCLQ